MKLSPTEKTKMVAQVIITLQKGGLLPASLNNATPLYREYVYSQYARLDARIQALWKMCEDHPQVREKERIRTLEDVKIKVIDLFLQTVFYHEND